MSIHLVRTSKGELTMVTTIILAHPWHGSFNKSIMDALVEGLQMKNKKYEIIDLNADNFNPVMTQEDLALFSKGQSTDPLVEKYQNILRDTEQLIFIFPLWWFDVPAILKGFFDKVMLKDFAYVETTTGLKGQLVHIKKTTVITTSNSPKWYIQTLAGNPIRNLLINTNLKGMGIKNVSWVHCGDTKKDAQDKRIKFLDKVKQLDLN